MVMNGYEHRLHPRESFYNIVATLMMSAGVNIISSVLLSSGDLLAGYAGIALVASSIVFFRCAERSVQYMLQAADPVRVDAGRSAEVIAFEISTENEENKRVDRKLFYKSFLFLI